MRSVVAAGGVARLLFVRQPKKNALVVLLVAVGFSVVGIAALYLVGGTGKVNPGFLILPVLLVSGYFGPLSGIAAALAVGLGAGPWMPLGPEESQAFADWALRIVLYAAAGVLVGLLSARLQQVAEREVQEREARLSRATELLQHTPEALQQERLKALGQMASGVVHDLNNALTPIQGYCDLLLRYPSIGADQTKLTEYLRIIHTASKDASQVVGRLREFYRKASDGGPPVTAVNVPRTVEEACLLTMPAWKAQANARGVTIQIDTVFAEEIPAVKCNEFDLRIMLTNLILNAVDAMPQSGRIVISASRKEDFVLLEVRDNGVGMDTETRARCLEPFFTTKPNGTGMGLPLVKGTIDQYGGFLELASEIGKGSTVTIGLPVYRQPAEEKGHSGQGLRILVIDDDTEVRRLVAAYLEMDNHVVVQAANGAEGFQLFEEDRFDLVVSDGAMPQLSGYDMARQMGKLRPEVPVIMLTGFAEPFLREHVSGNVREVLPKPIAYEDLHNAILRVFPAL